MIMRRPNARKLHVGLAVAAGAFFASSAMGQWVEFVKESNSSRMVSASSVGLGDTQEKDYSWGDLDQDGWIDLIAIRKQPFTSAGKRVNVLFMNEGGVLVDRTSEYASAVALDQITTSPGWAPHTDYPTDQGFLTATNDRASVLFDLDNDGWVDLAIATTISDGDPKHIGHPRVYMNLANDGNGAWQGLRFENARIPAMESWSGQTGRNPRFCSVTAGDVTGDGYAELYFGDYDSSGAGGVNQPFGADFNDKYLVNQGAANPGYFDDVTSTHFTGNITGGQSVNQPFPFSAFGAAVEIADLNLDGFNDIVKQTSLNAPTYVGVAYNKDGDGVFKSGSYYQVAIQAAPYFVSLGDLTNNGRLDMIVTDDATDRYLLNNSTSASGQVNWSSTTFLPEQNTGFGSGSVIVDFDQDGWNDIIIADVDVDIAPCQSNRRTNLYRNNGNAPSVTFTNGSSVIPSSERQGVFDVAAFDITGNGWTDLVFGRCTGTDIWIHVPPFDLNIEYPQPLPSVIDADTPTTVQVQLTPQGGSLSNPTLHTSINAGQWNQQPLNHLGGNLYEGTLPAVQCLDDIAFYFSGEVSGTEFTGPINAPTNVFTAFAANTSVVTSDHHFDGTDAGYSVENDPSLTVGEWTHGTPTGSLFGGQVAAPFGDASGDGQAWVTCLGGAAGLCNVDLGPTHLISQTFDLSEGPAEISYDRWMFCSNAAVPERIDYLRTYVSNDGGNSWVQVHETSGTGNEWETMTFSVSDYVTPSANVVVRFSVSDEGNGSFGDSVTNAGIDNVRVEQLACEDPVPPCPADLTGSGNVGVPDLLELLGAWGNNPGHAADLNGDGSVGVPDLLELLGAWGECPQ